MKHHLLSGVCVLFALAFCTLPAPAFADGLEEKAKTYYEHKQYQEALAIWYKMVEAGQPTSGLYFNIGLAESNLQNTAKAMLAFEQALRLAPLNETIQTAISQERRKIVNGTIPVSPFFLKEWFKGVVTFLRPGNWALIGLLIIAFGLFNFLAKSKGRIGRFAFSYRFTIFLLTLGLLFVVLGVLSYKEIYRLDEAIIHEACEIRKAPTGDSPEIKMAHPGEKIIILDELGEWYNVQLPNLDTGWVKKKCLTPIAIGRH